MIHITDKKKCTGCTACASVCGRHCITMKPDEEGFMYPVIEKENCVECGRCENVCPVLNPFDEKKVEPLCFGCRSKDEETICNSSSGGLFSVLAEKTLKDGGEVIGAAFRKDWSVHHVIIDSVGSLEQLRGSKYVQSDLEGVLLQVKQHLKNGKKVLFVGTPCQIAGVNHYIGDNDNLLTIDLICHSSPSPKVWKEYLDAITRKYGGIGKISRLTFRDKSLGWRRYSLLIVTKNDVTGKEKVLAHGGTCSNLYMRGFSQGLFNRPSCSECPARNFRSGSDITLGDCWAVEKYYPQYKNDEKGLSVVLLNTQKGIKAFENIASDIDLFKMRYEEVEPYDMHASLTRSIPQHPNRKKFFEMSSTMAIGQRIYICIRFTEIKNCIVNSTKEVVYKLIGEKGYSYLKKVYYGKKGRDSITI